MIFILAREILGREYNITIIKSILIRKPQKLKNGMFVFADRLLFFLYLIFFPIISLFIIRKQKSFNLIYEPTRIKRSDIMMRSEYISHYFLNDDGINDITHLNGSRLYISLGDFNHKVKLTFQLYLKSIKAYILSIFCKSKYSDKICIRLIAMLLNSIWTESEHTKVYCFKNYNVISYLFSILSSYIAPQSSYIVVVGNSYFYGKRYFYAPKISLCICAKYQIDEIYYYRKHNWVVVKDVFYKGLEEYSMYKTIQPKKPIYDIGIYSSGWWARKNGLFRVSDIDGIKKLKYCDNPIHNGFMTILNEIISLKSKYNFSIKFYLHPYERMLYNEYAISPPFIDILNDAQIDVDDSPGRSIDKLYECELGISLFSTIIADRWEYDLKGLNYYTDDFKELVCPRYMGKYSEYICSSPFELESKIIKMLNIDTDKNV